MDNTIEMTKTVYAATSESLEYILNHIYEYSINLSLFSFM